MIKTNLLLFVLFFYALNFQVDITKRCACSEYEEFWCQYIPYCSYFEKQCVPLMCSELSVVLCNVGLYTDFKCIWNDSINTCEDHEYECTEFNLAECYLNQYTKQCQYVDDSCQKWQSCSSATNLLGCNPLVCSFSVDGCGEPYSGIDCSGTDLNTCVKSNGEGQQCKMNDLNECQKTHTYPRSCSEFNNFKDQCKYYCAYDAAQNQCVENSCSFYKSQKDCDDIINMIDFTITPCVWKSETCQEAALEDLNQASCSSTLNAVWDSSSSKCQQCSQTEDNPQYSFLKAFIESQNNNYILLAELLIIITILQ